ncbi:Steroid 5 alpha-reductase 3 [Chamberlinius hualienensis]
MLGNYWHLLTAFNWLAIAWFSKILASMLVIMQLQFGKSNKPSWYKIIAVYGKAYDEKAVKSSSKQHSNIFSSILRWSNSFRVPKSYFGHFYLAGATYGGVMMLILLSSYATHNAPKHLVWYLDMVASTNRNAYGMDPTTTIVALTLMLFQVSRRAYECYRISVFSPQANMHISHYILGLVFYLNVITSIMAEAPGFTKQGFDHISFKNVQSWRWYQPVAIGCYFWAAWHQHRCMVILASLRKNGKDATTSGYKIPFGDWFNFLSTPHYSAEILIYFSLNILTHFNHSLLLLSFIFTFLNQFVNAIETHNYYIAHFKDYPKTRNILIPGIF